MRLSDIYRLDLSPQKMSNALQAPALSEPERSRLVDREFLLYIAGLITVTVCVISSMIVIRSAVDQVIPYLQSEDEPLRQVLSIDDVSVANVSCRIESLPLKADQSFVGGVGSAENFGDATSVRLPVQWEVVLDDGTAISDATRTFVGPIKSGEYRTFGFGMITKGLADRSVSSCNVVVLDRDGV